MAASVHVTATADNGSSRTSACRHGGMLARLAIETGAAVSVMKRAVLRALLVLAWRSTKRVRGIAGGHTESNCSDLI